MKTGFAAVSREFALRYAGLSFYWAWVFLSFNSIDIVGGDGRSLSFVHVASAAAAMVVFGASAVCFHRVAAWSAARVARVLAGCGVAAAAGTFLYSSPLLAPNPALTVAGALVTGLACSPIVLAWGVAYRGLDARRAVLFTSMTFFGAAVLYAALAALAALEPAFSSAGVSLLPLAAAATAVASMRGGGCARRLGVGVAHARGAREEVRMLVRTALSWRVLVGLTTALFAYGGLRVYFGDLAPDVFSDPWLMAGTIALAALIFFLYGTFASRTSLNLGVLYRIALSVWALAFVLIALVGQGNAWAVFFMASLSSVLFEVLTWALLAEIARTTHFSPLLVFAMGRLAVHAGIVTGELAAFAFVGDVTAFAVTAVFVLVVSAGFTFADRDTTFAFESPTPTELARLAALGEKGASGGESGDEGGAAEGGVGGVRASKGSGVAAGASSVDVGLVPPSEGLAARIDALAAAYQLSPREKEVFALWVTGHGSKYIQEKFVISPATVKTHVRHIYEKFDVHNRAELMRKLEEAR
ncbi:helix-turn-helix transcriptional regulator [Gordonibacter sp. An230]|uniref:helix-turn-helix transcriptional regulator n=1 Tax=Gordonibacter sp. An230 TaxID=1965592 RepID=UPI000B3957B1|nr:helix-turn-helix transcriptional regulator [Gordonibacter sp. An230]OUO87984.1 helix-turn-helix transcriptional regulator [Gordonibacter sp. An230]